MNQGGTEHTIKSPLVQRQSWKLSLSTRQDATSWSPPHKARGPPLPDVWPFQCWIHDQYVTGGTWGLGVLWPFLLIPLSPASFSPRGWEALKDRNLFFLWSESQPGLYRAAGAHWCADGVGNRPTAQTLGEAAPWPGSFLSWGLTREWGRRGTFESSERVWGSSMWQSPCREGTRDQLLFKRSGILRDSQGPFVLR